MDDGYPKEIEKGFEGIPNNVDAAFVWTGNEKIYFFKVRQCLELHCMKYIYPKLMSLDRMALFILTTFSGFGVLEVRP